MPRLFVEMPMARMARGAWEEHFLETELEYLFFRRENMGFMSLLLPTILAEMLALGRLLRSGNWIS